MPHSTKRRFSMSFTPVSETDGFLEVSSSIGKNLSNYRILAVVGPDGFGVKYKAEDLNSGRPVLLHLLGKKPDDPWVQEIESRGRYPRA